MYLGTVRDYFHCVILHIKFFYLHYSKKPVCINMITVIFEYDVIFWYIGTSVWMDPAVSDLWFDPEDGGSRTV